MLEAAASAAGRSLSTEAQFRLERSFHTQGGLQEALETAYGPQGAALLTILGRLIRGAPGAHGLPIEADWLSDPNSFDHVSNSVRVALDALRPPGEIRPEGRARSENMAVRLLMLLVERTGQSWVTSVLKGLGQPASQRFSDWVKRYWADRFDEEGGTP
jgi:hypothetical protein